MLKVTYPQKVSWPPQSWAIANVLTVSGTFIISRSILFIIINTVTKVFLKPIPSPFLLTHTHMSTYVLVLNFAATVHNNNKEGCFYMNCV